MSRGGDWYEARLIFVSGPCLSRAEPRSGSSVVGWSGVVNKFLSPVASRTIIESVILKFESTS